MKILNRAVVILKPKPPYFEWTSQFIGHLYHSGGTRPAIAFLVADIEDQKTGEQIVRNCYQTIFEEELSTWTLDKAAWPKTRDWNTFEAWFDVELRSLVLDLCNYEMCAESW